VSQIPLTCMSGSRHLCQRSRHSSSPGLSLCDYPSRSYCSPVLHRYANITGLVTSLPQMGLFVYYESKKRKIKTKYVCGCRCYERLQPNTKEFTRLAYTEMVLELEHLKIQTRASVRGKKSIKKNKKKNLNQH
jgi:hypothetical protein